MSVERTKIYFLSDVHLGAPYHRKHFGKPGYQSTACESSDNPLFVEHEIERKLCRWFDKVKADAKIIYLLGDIFDYWFEYKNVVPRGFVRVLGKIAELTDAGVEMHFFIGNHDIWITDYLRNECGLIIHTQPLVVDHDGKKFFLAHGDGLGDDSRSFRIIRRIFHSKTLRVPFAAIHPRWTVGFAHAWASHSRETGEMLDYLGEDKEHLVLYAKQHLKSVPDINFFIFGHRHILLDLQITPTCRTIILGDWINYYSYGVWDGEKFVLEIFEEQQ
nr:UDP-2,3-diacylglucosamine diphosphatase [Dysgonomonas sp. 25]